MTELTANETAPADKLAALERAIDALPIDAAPDAWAELLERVAFVKAAARRLDERIKAKLLERVSSGGDLLIGTVRYYAGIEKRVEPRDRGAVLAAVLELAGGDVAAAARDFLAAGAFKHGSIRQAAGEDRFAELFEVVEQQELREGRPAKTLKAVDTRFSR
ncbi:hypothetical protein [Fontivita pretiosa]|uniref:hypothetical protein n=1 Tax=Fontivita pretiosa TaxID=2989684 RepID=UPI003D181C53